jgi:hypothetical protein
MNDLDKKFCHEIFEASKIFDSERALSAYHKLGEGKADVRVYTALIKSVSYKRLTFKGKSTTHSLTFSSKIVNTWVKPLKFIKT